MTFWNRVARWIGLPSDGDESSSNDVPKVRGQERLLADFELPEGVASQGRASERTIRQFEKLIDARLPDDYCVFLTEHDGAIPSEACDWTISDATLDPHPTGSLQFLQFHGFAADGENKLGYKAKSLWENVPRSHRPFRDMPWRHIAIAETTRGALFMSLRQPNFGACYVVQAALVDYFASGFAGTMTKVLYHESTRVATSFSDLWKRSRVDVSEENARSLREHLARFPTLFGKRDSGEVEASESVPGPEQPDEPEPDQPDEIECVVRIVEVVAEGARRYFAVPYRRDGDASDYVAAVASEVISTKNRDSRQRPKSRSHCTSRFDACRLTLARDA